MLYEAKNSMKNGGEVIMFADFNYYESLKLIVVLVKLTVHCSEAQVVLLLCEMHILL